MDYTNYEYEDLVARITELYKTKEGMGDGFSSSTGQTLIELLADSNDNLMYMLERRVQEAFMQTARLESSVWAHASEVGYRPTRAVAASGILSLCLKDADNNNTLAAQQITIPKGTKITGRQGGDFVTTEDVIFSIGEGQKNIPVKQGKEEIHTFNFNQEPYTSIGEITFNEYHDIDEYSLIVTEGNEEYYDIQYPPESASEFTNITSLNFAGENDELYDILYRMDGMRIIFGDGIFGKKPTGAVRVRFLRTEGDEVAYMTRGNRFDFETETINPDFISAIDAPEYKYDMINIREIQGGSSHESFDDIKKFSSSYVRTANRAVTSTDYEFWVEKSGIGDIVDVRAYSEHDTGDLIFTMNNVYISYLTSSGLGMNLVQKTQMRNFLDRHKTLTHHLVISEADKISIIANIFIRKNRNVPTTNSHFYEIVKSKVDEYFKLQNGSIGRFVQHSEFVKYLQNSTFNLNGIDYSITDYVRVDFVGEYDLQMPPEVFEVSFEINNSYTPTTGDTFILSLDGELFQVGVFNSDSIYDILSKMRDLIFLESTAGYLVALDGEGNDAKLFVRSRARNEIFSVNINNGTISDSVEYNIIHQIPIPESDVSVGNKILPNTIQIVDQDSEVIFEDDGQGMMIPVDLSFGSPFKIEYDKARMSSPRILDGDYFVRFQQNDYMNFRGNYKTAVLLSPIADKLNEDPLKSTIAIIERD